MHEILSLPHTYRSSPSSNQVIAACSTEAGLGVYTTATSSSSSNNITPVKMDMSSETNVQALAETLTIQHPEGLYALVNNNNNTVVGKDGAIEWMSVENYKMYVGWVRWCHTGQGRRDSGRLCLLRFSFFSSFSHTIYMTQLVRGRK